MDKMDIGDRTATDRPSVHTSAAKRSVNPDNIDCNVDIVLKSGFIFTTSLGIPKQELLKINKSPLWNELCDELRAMNIVSICRSDHLEVHKVKSDFTNKDLEFVLYIFQKYSHRVNIDEFESVTLGHASSHYQGYTDLHMTKPYRSESIGFEPANYRSYEATNVKDDSSLYSRSHSLPETREKTISYPGTYTTHFPEKSFPQQEVRELGTNSMNDKLTDNKPGGRYLDTNKYRTEVKLDMNECHYEKNTVTSRQINGSPHSYSGNLSKIDQGRSEHESSTNDSGSMSTKTLISSQSSFKEECQELDGKTLEIQTLNDICILIKNTEVQDIIKGRLGCTHVSSSENNMTRLHFNAPGEKLEEIPDRFENIFSKVTVEDLSCKTKLKDLVKQLHFEEKVVLREKQKILTIVGVKESIFHLLYAYTNKHRDGVFNYFSFENVNGLYEMLIKELIRANVVLFNLNSSIELVGTFDDVKKWRSAYEKVKKSAKHSTSDVDHDNKLYNEVYIDPRYVILCRKKPDVLDAVHESLGRDYRRLRFADDGRIIIPENNTHERLLEVQKTIDDLLVYRELIISESNNFELKQATMGEKYILLDASEKLSLIGIRKYVDKFLEEITMPILKQVEFIHTNDNFKLCKYAKVIASEIEEKYSQADCSIKIYPMVTGTEKVQFCKVDINEQSSAAILLLPTLEAERKNTEREKDGRVLSCVGNDEYILNLQYFLCKGWDDLKTTRTLNDILRKERVNKFGVLLDERYESRHVTFILQFLLDCSFSCYVDIFVPMTTDLQLLRRLVDNELATNKKQYGGEGHFIELDCGYSTKNLTANTNTKEVKSMNAEEMNENIDCAICERLPRYRDIKSLIEVERTVRMYLEKAGAKNWTNVILPVLGVGQLGYPAELVAKCMLRQIDDFFKFNTNTSVCHVKIPLKDEEESTREVFFRENISRIKQGIMVGDTVHKVGILISSPYTYQEKIEGYLRNLLNEPLQQRQLLTHNRQREGKKQNGITPVAESSTTKRAKKGEDEQRKRMDIEENQDKNGKKEFFQAVLWKLKKDTISKLSISSDSLKRELEGILDVDVDEADNGDFNIEMSQEQKDKAESFMTNIGAGNGGARPKEIKATSNRSEQITVDYYTLKAVKKYVGKSFPKNCYEVSPESDESYLVTVKEGSTIRVQGKRSNLHDVINSFYHEQIDLLEDKISDVYEYIDKLKGREPPYCFVNDDTQSLHVCGLDRKEVSGVINEVKRKVLMGENSRKHENYDSNLGNSLSISVGRLQVCIKKADITKLDVDIVVNAANEVLSHGGGVAMAISKAAGRKLQDDGRNYIRDHGKIPVTNLCKTSAGEMKSKLVYHAVGPMWYSYEDKTKCLDDLCKTVIRCLIEADRESTVCKSIAFPSISAAIFGVPQRSCSTAYAKAVHYFNSIYKTSNLQTIIFVDINDTMVKLIKESFHKIQSSGFEDDGREQEIMRNFINDVGLKLSEGKSQTENSVSERKDIAQSGYNVQVIKNDGDEYMEFKLEGGINICVYKGDVTTADTESFTVIEDQKMNNFASSTKSIIDKAGSNYLAERSKVKKENHSAFMAGTVCTLQAGNLKFKHIFHLIVSLQPSQEEIQKVVDNLLKETKRTGTTSVAIGIGKLDAAILLEAILSKSTRSSSCLKEIHLVVDFLETIEKVKAVYGGKSISSPSTNQPIEDEKICSICLSEINENEILSCGHEFCKPCITEALKKQKKCPVCRQVVKGGWHTGNQPVDGRMKHKKLAYSIPGFPGYRAIQIEYYFPSGIQTEEHPNPGKRYESTSRTAYLPDNAEGREILKLLKIAFERRLTFTIGRSVTSGREGVITWNDIHHKTSIGGGPNSYGYPDPHYLQRVRDELKAQGVSAETEV